MSDATVSPRALVAAGTGLIAVTYGMIRFGYGLHLPMLTAEFSLSSGLAGAIAAGSFVAYCVAALVAQRVLVSTSARPVLWGAAAVAAAGSVLVAVSWSAGVLAVGVLLSGSAAGAASPALVTAVGRTLPARWEARAQGIVNAGTGLGVAAGALIVLAAPQAWRLAWVVSAVAALVTAAIADRSTRWSSEPDAGGDPLRGAAATSLWPLVGLLRRPVLAAAIAGAGSAAVWTFGRDLLTTTGGLPERTTALVWCVLGAAAVLGASSGAAVQRWGLRRAWTCTVVISAAGTALLAAAASSAVLAAVAGALFGGAYTALTGVLIAWATELHPHAAGRATAVLFIALTAGQALGAVGTGVLITSLGGPGAFMVSAALLACAAALSAPRPGRSPRPTRRSPRGSARPASS